MPKETVLLFRAQAELPEDDGYCKKLSELGLAATSIPVLDFNFINSDLLLEALKNPNEYNGIIFTSPRAVEAIANCTGDEWHKRIGRQWTNHRHFAVGHGTTSIADSLLGLACQGKGSGNAKLLAELIVKDGTSDSSKPYLFPCSNLSRETLPTILTQSAIPFRCLHTYETVVHPKLQTNLENWISETGFPDYVVFFSPSGISHALPMLRTANTPMTSVKFVAIGPTTAEALRSFDIDVHCVASEPNADALTSAIAAHRT